MGRLTTAMATIAAEPPFRLLTRFVIKHCWPSVETRALWDISPRPAYLLGLMRGAREAKNEGIRAIAVAEFGVAGGRGLVILQTEAEAVERETGIEILVYGFDMGASGLPELIGDHRDQPERWKTGDYPMDEELLRSRLTSRTTLILGNVAQTASEFFARHHPPHLGFVAFDMDLYSSTMAGFQIFTDPNRKMLIHCPLYFDDLGSFTYHRFAGELLAIDEFNAADDEVKIDVWAGVRDYRPFYRAAYLGKMYVAHDLAAAVRAQPRRETEVLPL
jgi:hypothetical protein